MRVDIARALLLNQKLVVFDEFTSVVDREVAKIASYDRAHDPQLTVGEPGLGKITRGQILHVTPTKIPRIIGRKGSMISMIKQCCLGHWKNT